MDYTAQGMSGLPFSYLSAVATRRSVIEITPKLPAFWAL